MSNLNHAINLTHAINGLIRAMEREGKEGRPGAISPTVDAFLRSCLKGEFELRYRFATDPLNPITHSPYMGLFDIFDLPGEATLARPRNWNDQGQFTIPHEGQNYPFPWLHILPVPPHLQRTAGTPCIVDDISAFRKAWSIFSGGILSPIRNWDNILVAGGSVLACLSSFPSDPSEKELFDIYQSPPYHRSDIDLFLWGLNEDEARAKMQEIFEAINSAVPWDVVCFRTNNTITIQAEYPKRPLQIIMRLYKSPAEILCGFDVDCCCVAYNGTNVFTNPRGLTAIVRQCNTIDLLRRSPSYEHRLAKYSDRGYEVFYPELDRERINYYRLSEQERTTFPQGLGRLIVYEIMRVDYKQFPMLYENMGENDPSSPVTVDSLRPSNYDYAWVKIPYGDRWWSVKKVRDHVEKKAAEIIDAHDRGSKVHRHVISCGTMAECLECCCDDFNAGNQTLGRLNEGELANGFFRGPAAFIVDDPGRQTIGSFNPIGNDGAPDYDLWEEEAYAEDDSDADA